LNGEFRRQLRSLFAVLRAIVRRSSEGEGSKSDFAAHLEGRIGALARAHDMLMRAPDQGIDLAELVHGELLAQAVPPRSYRADGPDTRIGREAAMPLALALHELTMNAVIHGALASTQGTLEVTWDQVERDGRRWFRLSWQERGMQTRSDPPTSKGFGLELIEQMLPYEVEAWTNVEWLSSGMRCEILLPDRANVAFWSSDERMIAR